MPKKGQKKNPKQSVEDGMKLVTEALHEWQVCVSLQEEEVQNDRALLDESRREFEEERRSIMSEHVCANDIIGINMGGEKIIQVKRSVLTQHEGTYLAAMFSGRWEEQLTRDRDGNVFFDEPPEVMMPLISCLRRTAAGPHKSLDLPEPRSEWRSHFVKMMDRFGLQMLVAPRPQRLQQGCVVEHSAEWCKVQWDDDLSVSMHWFASGRVDNLVRQKIRITNSIIEAETDELQGVVESPHPYENSSCVWHKLQLPFAEEMHVFFDPKSSFEANSGSTYGSRDGISFYTDKDHSSQRYGEASYGFRKIGDAPFECNLPSQSSPLRIPCSHCWVLFTSDESVVDWGYKIYAIPSKLRGDVAVTAESCFVGLKVVNIDV